MISEVLTDWLSSTNATLMDELFTMHELISALASVNLLSSPGADGVTYSALRYLGGNALRQLLTFYNKSWETGRVEASWKLGRLAAVLKPGKPPTDINSYRPIALLSYIGKVMEKMVLQRLVWDLEDR